MTIEQQGPDIEVPGQGPTTTVSVSLHSGTIGAVRERVGKRGVSSYVEAAVQRQIQRDNLDELIAAAEAEHGPLTPDEVQLALDRFDAALQHQTGAA